MGETKDWRESVSQPKYEMRLDEDVLIPARDGVKLWADVYRPDAEGKFPALISISPYGKDTQKLPCPPGASDYTRGTGGHESGMEDYFVPRGYVNVKADVRGTGNSDGEYCHFGTKWAEDGYDIVEWAAAQRWCNGKVGMLGMSWWATPQYLVAAQQPPHLKAIFIHDGYTDEYRHCAYHGGIFNFGFYHHIWRLIHTHMTKPMSEKEFSREELAAKLRQLKSSYEIQSYPYMWKLITHPEVNPLMLDLLLHPYDGPFYWERSACTKYDRIKVPVYFVTRWSAWAIHLPGVIDAFLNVKTPRKLLVTTTAWEGGFDRPWHENHDIVLRWYDHWLKGIDTGIMDEPLIKLWTHGINEWRTEREWPLARTRWTKFYLRGNGRLSETPPTWNEGCESFVNVPWAKPGDKAPCVKFVTEPLSEDLEVTGPLAVYFHAALSTDEANWMVDIKDIAPDGSETMISKGWLKASHRELDESKSKPYRPYHPHTRSLPIVPGRIYEYAIDIRDTSNVFKAGHRLQLVIKGQDAPWDDFFIWYHVNNMKETRHTIYHTPEYLSYLLMPVIPGQ